MPKPKPKTYDRNYLRQLYNQELMDLVIGQACPTELELVLVERLEEAEDEIAESAPAAE